MKNYENFSFAMGFKGFSDFFHATTTGSLYESRNKNSFTVKYSNKDVSIYVNNGRYLQTFTYLTAR